MKKLIALLLLISTVMAGAADENKPVPTMPSEVTLTSGRVLRKVTVLRWEKERVVLKYAGGADPIHFSLIKSVARAELEAIREADSNTAARKTREEQIFRESTRLVTGQVFVVTNARGNVTVGDLNIHLVPREEMDSFKTSIPTRNFGRIVWHDDAPQQAAWLFDQFKSAPIGERSTRTDGEGRFTLNVPNTGEYYIFARDSRMLYTTTEWYVWLKLLPMDASTVTMSNSDLWKPR